MGVFGRCGTSPPACMLGRRRGDDGARSSQPRPLTTGGKRAIFAVDYNQVLTYLTDPPSNISGGLSVKLIYAIAFALFPLAASAQDASLPSALCHDDYYEDTAGECDDTLTVEAILEKYTVVIPGTDAGLATIFLVDPEDIAVGSIRPRDGSPAAEHAILKDDELGADPEAQEDTIASQIVAPAPQPENSVEGVDDVIATGPTAQRSPIVSPSQF